MKVYKLDKQGEVAPVGYHHGNSGNNPVEAPKALYFASVAAAEAHLTKVLGNLPANAGNEEYRVYRTHMGQYTLETVEVLGAEPTPAPEAAQTEKAE